MMVNAEIVQCESQVKMDSDSSFVQIMFWGVLAVTTI